MEVSSHNMLLTGIPNVVSELYNYTVTYRDGVESYPVVETIRCDTEIIHIYLGRRYRIKLNSVMFATDNKINTIGAEIKKYDNLFRKIADSEYNQEFWDNNPIVRRTQVEQQVVDDFNRLGYFGSMQID